MVVPVSDPGLLATVGAPLRPISPSNAVTEGITPTLRRAVAITAKFGPDPETGSPLQFIAGADVEAAETMDLQRLAEANLGLSSAENMFQAQSIRSDQELGVENGASSAGQAAQQSLAATLGSAAQIGGVGLIIGARGISIDIKV